MDQWLLFSFRLHYVSPISFPGTLSSYFWREKWIWSCALASFYIYVFRSPASYYTFRQYLFHLRGEEAKARVTPKQAVHLFFDKLLPLCSFLKKQVSSFQIPPSQRYLYARDLAFFCLDFFASDRASDLGRVFTSEEMNLPDSTGFLFCRNFGKKGERL